MLDDSTVNYEIVEPSYTAGSAILADVSGASQFTVYNANILASDVIRLGVQTFAPDTASVGTLSYVISSDPVFGPYFTVTSSNNADRSVVAWQIVRSSGSYAGGVTLTTGGSTVVSPSLVSIANETLVFSNYITNVNSGFLSQGAIVTGTSFEIISSSNTDTSNVVTILRNLPLPGQYLLPDMTNPATLLSGDPRGVYIPSIPSDGISRLTIWMYNRGVLNANATIGANPADPLFFNNNVNLYGVPPYSDSDH